MNYQIHVCKLKSVPILQHIIHTVVMKFKHIVKQKISHLVVKI